MSAKQRFLSLIILLGILGTGTLIAHTQGFITKAALINMVERGGFFAPLVYVAAGSVLVAAWAPRGLLSVVGGALFGPWLGGALALLMGSLGAVIGYIMAFRLGHDYVEEKHKKKALRIIAFVRKRGFWAILACRVCPLVPSELISLAAGVSAIPFVHFMGATLIGMAPTAFLYAAFGSALLDEGATTLKWGSMVGFALLTLMTAGALADLWRKEAKKPKDSDSGGMMSNRPEQP